jgi:hypothetical protein
MKRQPLVDRAQFPNAAETGPIGGVPERVARRDETAPKVPANRHVPGH